MVELVEPSLKMVAALLLKVSAATAVVWADEVASTSTLTVAVSVPEVAVTVMVRGVESPAVDRVASAAPLVSVVAWVIATPPESAANATVTPEIRSFEELRASTVMVAVAEPSEGIEVALLIAVSELAWEVPPLLLPLLPPLLLLLLPVRAVMLSPLQAASNNVPNKATIDKLRM
jgi:hypothetical protein